jgi:hypothetical protein
MGTGHPGGWRLRGLNPTRGHCFRIEHNTPELDGLEMCDVLAWIQPGAI